MCFVLLLGTAMKNLNWLHLFYFPLYKILIQTGKVAPVPFFSSGWEVQSQSSLWSFTRLTLLCPLGNTTQGPVPKMSLTRVRVDGQDHPLDLLAMLFLMLECCWPSLLWGHTAWAGSIDLQEEMLQRFLLPGRWNKRKYLLLTWMLASPNKKQHMVLAAFPKAFTAVAMLYARNLIWQNIFHQYYFRQEFK